MNLITKIKQIFENKNKKWDYNKNIIIVTTNQQFSNYRYYNGNWYDDHNDIVTNEVDLKHINDYVALELMPGDWIEDSIQNDFENCCGCCDCCSCSGEN